MMDYPTLNRLDLTEQTYRILREQILKRDLQPGDKVSVDAVARGLGVSRTPVVNALKLLENDGLVEIQPRRGTFITELAVRDVADLFEIRLLIELYAVDHLFATGRTAQMGEVFAAHLEEMKGAIAEEAYVNYEAFISSDRDLHSKLVETINNRRLISIYNELNIHMHIARAHYLNTVENARQAQKEHEDMYVALKNHDLEGMKKALSIHITNVKQRILGLLEERGGKL